MKRDLLVVLSLMITVAFALPGTNSTLPTCNEKAVAVLNGTNVQYTKCLRDLSLSSSSVWIFTPNNSNAICGSTSCWSALQPLLASVGADCVVSTQSVEIHVKYEDIHTIQTACTQPRMRTTTTEPVASTPAPLMQVETQAPTPSPTSSITWTTQSENKSTNMTPLYVVLGIFLATALFVSCAHDWTHRHERRMACVCMPDFSGCCS